YRIRREVHEVPVLLEPIAHRSDACTDVGDDASRNPCESPDRSTRRAQVQAHVRRERDTLEGRRLLDRQVVVVDEVAELRLVIRARVATREDDVDAGRE